MNKALLDTDILSEISKGVDPRVAENAANYRRAFHRYTISVISIMEVVRGFEQKQSLERLQRFLMAIATEEILVLNHAASELAGRMAGKLDRLGQTIGRADPMIAAIALEHGLELVTGNTSHYDRIRQLGYPLTVVNWR